MPVLNKHKSAAHWPASTQLCARNLQGGVLQQVTELLEAVAAGTGHGRPVNDVEHPLCGCAANLEVLQVGPSLAQRGASDDGRQQHRQHLAPRVRPVLNPGAAVPERLRVCTQAVKRRTARLLGAAQR